MPQGTESESLEKLKHDGGALTRLSLPKQFGECYAIDISAGYKRVNT